MYWPNIKITDHTESARIRLELALNRRTFADSFVYPPVRRRSACAKELLAGCTSVQPLQEAATLCIPPQALTIGTNMD